MQKRARKDWRTTKSLSEARCWTLLRDRRLVNFRFRRQPPVDDYIAARDAHLRGQGFRILRVWNHHILPRPDTDWAAPHEVQA